MEDSKIKIPSPLLNTFPGQHGTVQLWRWGAGSKLGLKVRRNSTITQMDPKLEFQPPYQKKMGKYVQGSSICHTSPQQTY